jgi:hypothetical protein
MMQQKRSNISYGNLDVPVTILETPHDGKNVMTYIDDSGAILRHPVAASSNGGQG